MLRLRFGLKGRALKHVCRECEARRALFRYRGVVKWDRYHTLCFQCYRRWMDRQRVAAPAAGSPAVMPPPASKQAVVA